MELEKQVKDFIYSDLSGRHRQHLFFAPVYHPALPFQISSLILSGVEVGGKRHLILRLGDLGLGAARDWLSQSKPSPGVRFSEMRL